MTRSHLAAVFAAAAVLLVACRSRVSPSGEGGAASSGVPGAGGAPPSAAAPEPSAPPPDEAEIARLADDLVNLYGPTVSMAMLSLSHAGPAAVPELTRRLQSADVNMRYRALIVLGRIGDRSAEAAIRALLDDPNEQVRVSARIALLRFGAREELPSLLDLARTPDPPALRAAALSGLATLRVEEALPAFREGIRAREPDVRYWAIQGLRALEDRASAGELVTLLCDPNATVAAAAADALRALGSASTHADVAKAFAAAKGEQRALVLELLRDLAHPDLATFVRQAVADDAPAVRAVAMCLAPRAAPDAASALEWLEAGSRDASATVRSLALRGLGLVGGEAATSILARALFDEDPFCRYNACAGLARAGAADKAGDLEKLESGDGVLIVRGAAREARARLGVWSAVEGLVADLDDGILSAAARAALADLFAEDLGPFASVWREKVLDRGAGAYRYDGELRRFVPKAG